MDGAAPCGSVLAVVRAEQVVWSACGLDVVLLKPVELYLWRREKELRQAAAHCSCRAAIQESRAQVGVLCLVLARREPETRELCLSVLASPLMDVVATSLSVLVAAPAHLVGRSPFALGEAPPHLVGA